MLGVARPINRRTPATQLADRIRTVVEAMRPSGCGLGVAWGVDHRQDRARPAVEAGCLVINEAPPSCGSIAGPRGRAGCRVRTTTWVASLRRRGTCQPIRLLLDVDEIGVAELAGSSTRQHQDVTRRPLVAALDLCGTATLRATRMPTARLAADPDTGLRH